MKNIKRIFQAGLLAVGSLFCMNTSYAQAIPVHFFGENAWMPDTIGNVNACAEPPCVLYGKLHQHWNEIKESKTAIIRFGGIGVDKNIPTNYQYIRMIDSIRANGMEPIIQVPFYNYRYSASQAAAIVQYINVTKSKHIKYWIIANEPDLSYGYNTPSQIANYFKPFASAMKAVDPSIFIVGPEIASFNQYIMTGLTTPGGPDDITGKDAAGRYYLDVISFHTYPFNGSQTRSQVITKLTAPTSSLDANLVFLNARVAACNTYHNRTGGSTLKTAITEANINWQNSPSDNLNGLGVNSFIGGQFVAEMLGVAMKNKVDFVNIWSVIEGNSTASDIGYLDPHTYAKKPMYYHFKMMAQNFKGNYANGVTNQVNVKSFGSKNSQQICVLIMNQDLSNNYNYTVRLNTGGISGSSALKVNIDAGVSMEYTGTISNQSTTLLRFNASGTLIEMTEYKLNGNASLNLPPTVTSMTTTDVASAIADENVNLEMNVFPNPSVGKFTVALNKANTDEKAFDVEMYNLIGQTVYKKKLTFVNGKEEIELDPSVASGTYVVRVKQDNQVLTKKVILTK